MNYYLKYQSERNKVEHLSLKYYPFVTASTGRLVRKLHGGEIRVTEYVTLKKRLEKFHKKMNNGHTQR